MFSIFINNIIEMQGFNMDVKGVKEVIPMGLIKGSNPRQTIENVELRATLEKAVEDAKLNVTERMALNKKFFPNGGGFNLFPEGIRVPKFNTFYRPGQVEADAFTKEVQAIKIYGLDMLKTLKYLQQNPTIFHCNVWHYMEDIRSSAQSITLFVS